MSGAALLALGILAAGGAVTPGPALPEGRARYRMALGGETVGLAELSVACEATAARCLLRWETRLRLPVEAGGAVRTRRVEVPVRPDGHATARARLTADGLSTDGAELGQEAVPASAVELVLARGEPRCVPASDEETGRSGPACAGAAASSMARAITFLGITEEVWPGADGFPERVDVPAQRVTYRRDPAAAVPARVAFSARVRGPDDPALARRFCALELDPLAPGVEPGAALPPLLPSGESCQVQAAAYAAAARRRGLATRIAVGVAHDGAGFVWHAWAEVETPGGWAVVDPAFGQAPARGPRFTVARHGEDAASAREAGRRVLECWGAQVE